MIKWINILKDAFLIYDDFKDSGQRLSVTMVTAGLMVISSVLVLTGIIPTGFTDAEVMAIGTGIYSLVIMVIRLFSDGGKIKLQSDIKPNANNRHGAGDGQDEHIPNLPGDD